MIEMIYDDLRFSFLDIHPEAKCSVRFLKTLRIPDDGNYYFLPPGIGSFPLRHVEDYSSRLPDSWALRGGAMLSMYQSEALWIEFDGSYPMAFKIAAGKINAVTGEPWTNELSDVPQDYVVVPQQPWLDGFYAEKGRVRQFVAMPLGEGFTTEEQITGDAVYGGIQIAAFPMKSDNYKELLRNKAEIEEDRNRWAEENGIIFSLRLDDNMGLAPGGNIEQGIFKDIYGIDAWEISHCSRCFIHILNSEQWFSVTRSKPEFLPPSAAHYAETSLPWFSHYSEDRSPLDGAPTLAALDSIVARQLREGFEPLQGNESFGRGHVVRLGRQDPNVVRPLPEIHRPHTSQRNQFPNPTSWRE